MRRPLAMVSLVMVLIIWMYTLATGVPDYFTDQVCNQALVTLKGYVQKKEIKNDRKIIYLKGITFCDTTFPKIKSNIGIMCYLEDGCDMPKSGSFVMLSGKPGEFEHSRNPGCFDMKNYYASKGYFMPLYSCEIKGESLEYSRLREGLYEISEYMGNIYDQIFNESDASVVKAIVLGDKNDMDKELKSLYQKSGISHILSISGLHISIIGMFFISLLKKINFNRYLSIIISAVIVALYCMLTGMGTGALRACIMFIIMLLAISRTYDLITALSLTAMLFCINNRFITLSSGFWLSFMAVFGIAVFSKALVVTDEIENTKLKKIINSIVSCFSVSVFTFPILLYSYYEFSLYSVILNILLIPLMGILLGFGIVSGLAGIFDLTAGRFIGLPCHMVLLIYESVCRAVSGLPLSQVIWGQAPVWKLVVYYVICVIVMWLSVKHTEHKLYENKRPAWWMHIKLRFFMVLAGLLIFVPIRYGLKIYMLDVGQGDGICMTYDSKVIMMDGGSSSEGELARYTLLPFFRSRGISKIDYWFISHPDSDHYSGLLEMLESDEADDISIKRVILPDVKNIKEDGDIIIKACAERNIDVTYMARGDVLSYKKLNITEINPERATAWQDVNGYSQVLFMEYKNARLLFTGDATTESEKEYISYAINNGIDIKDIDIYKVAHHGSDTSSSQELIDYIQPKVAIISSGRKNKYGHPKKQIVERLSDADSQIYNTQDCGAVIISVGNRGYEVAGCLRGALIKKSDNKF